MISLHNYIEHTALKPDLTIADVDALCAEAVQHVFAGVCVPAYFVPRVNEILGGTSIDIVTVIGFPYGYNSIMSKYEEAEDAMHAGAIHLDMVVHIAAVKNGDWDTVQNEIATITRLAHAEGRILKLIAETGVLSEVELDLVINIANEAGVDYLKTSTGVNGPGANVDIVKYLRSKCAPGMQIKASGGIRTKADAIALIEAGANRLGTSKSIDIING
ncbi:MAG: deoxyribose-phosphate aldolase [Chitinophagales bacterium]